MVELSETARKGLDDYLRQVRTYLRWSRSLDRDEVEQNIAAHIERELEGTPQPVSSSALEGVLARLGSPRQWVPPEALGWWAKLILKLRTDSEDWRLAYISFALLLAGFLLFLASPLLLVFIAASFITSRAALAAAGDENLGAQKWLLYPALVIGSAILATAVLCGPGLLAGTAGAELYQLARMRHYSDMDIVEFVIISATLITGLWWVVSGLTLCKRPALARGPLRPFADRFNRHHALALFSTGVLLLILVAGYIASLW